MSMRILYYNWCPINEKQGGGIVVYQNNVLDTLNKFHPEIETFFLSAGFYYDNNNKTFIRREHIEGHKNIFSIVNSPIYSPIQSPIDNIEKMISDQEVDNLFESFIETYGPFDVIHFETLEGLPLSIAALKRKYLSTKFIISAHNYTLVCPNVQLWTDSCKNCMVEKKFTCEKCLRKYSVPSTKSLKTYRKFENSGQHRLYSLSRAYTAIRRRAKNLGGETEQYSQEILMKYRKQCIETINEYFDCVLAVSLRVKEILVFFGIREELIRVSYIGTKFASIAQYRLNKPSDTNPFGIVYMGYMRVEKGFYFFLDALEKMDSQLASGISITFASKIQDISALRRMKRLKKKFKEIVIYNGYTHADIQKIIESNSIGVVPVMWEDNLPQVTIEMIASGLPVLTSSFGGAKELNDSPYFVYDGGNTADFLHRVNDIYNNRNLLDEYWKTSKKLISMQDHITSLMEIYGANNTNE